MKKAPIFILIIFLLFIAGCSNSNHTATIKHRRVNTTAIKFKNSINNQIHNLNKSNEKNYVQMIYKYKYVNNTLYLHLGKRYSKMINNNLKKEKKSIIDYSIIVYSVEKLSKQLEKKSNDVNLKTEILSPNHKKLSKFNNGGITSSKLYINTKLIKALLNQDKDASQHPNIYYKVYQQKNKKLYNEVKKNHIKIRNNNRHFK